MQELSFYDMKGKKKFKSSNYKIVTRKVRGKDRKFAVAKAPSGISAWRILSG